jgi:hypothetical protein
VDNARSHSFSVFGYLDRKIIVKAGKRERDDIDGDKKGWI